MTSTSKKFGFTRKSGILMPISALPSPYGIGSFGKGAYDFCDFLSDTKTKCWQVLPLNPTSYGDSPYQSPASFAGNPYFIDLDILVKKGLLTRDEAKQNENREKRVDYGWLFETRFSVLEKAYRRFCDTNGVNTKKYAKFEKQNAYWLYDYALFMALKRHYNFSAWTSWEKEHRDANRARLHKEDFKEDRGFFSWIQFEFFCQWQDLCDYAHKKGIVIIGDMPIYTSHDSMEVWCAPEEFLLDDDYMPVVVAGCPPDDFSPDGQLWGNPIYNWELMEIERFEWWERRVRANFALYDVLRIDHFRGFAAYYNIPYGSTTAKDGKWDIAPGIKLFECIKERFPGKKIIVEDLGFITPDVRALLDYTGFPGMKMLQFAFYDDDNEYLPRMYKDDNCVVYPASHDSDCIKSFCKSLSGNDKKRFNKECKRNKSQSRTYDLIELALSSRANLAVVPIQDYLELENDDGRMNTPSVAVGNWTYRLSARYRSAALVQKIRNLNEKTRRCK